MTLDISEEALNKPKKKMDEYEQVFANNSEFFSSYNPDMIEEAFIKYLVENNVEHKLNKEKYKIKFKLFVTDKFNEKVTDTIEVVMRILLVKGNDSNHCCVEFTRLSGRLSAFLTHLEMYKNDVLKFANDTVKPLEIAEEEDGKEVFLVKVAHNHEAK